MSCRCSILPEKKEGSWVFLAPTIKDDGDLVAVLEFAFSPSLLSKDSIPNHYSVPTGTGKGIGGHCATAAVSCAGGSYIYLKENYNGVSGARLGFISLGNGGTLPE